MKTKTLSILALAIVFLGNVNAQIKLHPSGGISIGSYTDPLTTKVKHYFPVEFGAGATFLYNTSFEETTSFNNTVDFDNTVDFASIVNLDGTVNVDGSIQINGNFSISDVGSHLIPETGLGINLGATSSKWQNIYSVQLNSDYLKLHATSANVKSNLIPYTNNTYTLGTNESGTPYWWKDLWVYEIHSEAISTIDVSTETIELNNVDISGSTNIYGGLIKFDFSTTDNLQIQTGPFSHIEFHTSKSQFLFTKDVKTNGIFIPSDITAKENVQRIRDTGPAYEKLKVLEGIIYELKENPVDQVYAGFSAQDLQEVLPILVQENDKGELSVNYIGLIPYLVEALKEQEARIRELEILQIEKDKLESLK